MKMPVHEVSAHIQTLLRHKRFLYRHLPMNEHDWEDITQETLIHVARKWHQQRGKEWKPWVNTIAYRQFLNQVRNRTVAARRFKRAIFGTRVMQEDADGMLAPFWERDMAIPTDSIHTTRAAIADLPPAMREILQAYVDKGTWKLAARSLRAGLQTTYARALRAMQMVRTTI